MTSSVKVGPGTAGSLGGPVFFSLLIIAVSLLTAFFLAKMSSFVVLGALIGGIFLVACFLSPEFGVAVLIMSMLLSPEIGIGGGGGESVDGGRSIVIRLDDLLLVILSVSWIARTAVHKDLGLVITNPLNRPIGLYILSCAISTLLGYITGDVKGKVGIFFVLRYVEYFIVFFVTLNILDSQKKMKRFLNIAVFTSVCIALYGMYQIPSGVRVSAPFEGDLGEPNTLGGYLLLLMCMAGGQMLVTKSHRAIAGWAFYILFLLVPLLFTGSRASWLGIPIVIFAFFIFSHRKKQIAVFTFFLLVSAPTFIPESVKERILFTFMQQKQTRAKQLEIGNVRLDSSTTARLQSYKLALDGWAKKPIFGWGITGFLFVDSQFVRTAVETGIVGLLAFVWLVWTYFQGGLAAMRASPDRFQYGISIGYIAALFGLLTHSIGSNTFIILRIMEPWMVFTAMVFSIPMIQAEREKRWPIEESPEEGSSAEGAIETAPIRPSRSTHSTHGKKLSASASGDTPEDLSPLSKKRFKKKLSGYEEFLKREEVDQKRRELEEEESILAKAPKFRRPVARKKSKGEGLLLSSKKVSTEKGLPPSPERLENKPSPKAQRPMKSQPIQPVTPKSAPSVEPSKSESAPKQTKNPAPPLRAIDMARGMDPKKNRKV